MENINIEQALCNDSTQSQIFPLYDDISRLLSVTFANELPFLNSKAFVMTNFEHHFVQSNGYVTQNHGFNFIRIDLRPLHLLSGSSHFHLRARIVGLVSIRMRSLRRQPEFDRENEY